MVDQRYVIAFDPGKTTGWARLSNARFESGQLPWYDALHFVYETLLQGAQMTIICEDFIYTSNTATKTRQTWSTEGVGVLRFLCQRYDQEFVLQTPSGAKSFATNDKLRKLGWYTAGQDHANDAARHLLVYSVGNGLVRTTDLIGEQ